MTAAFVGGAAVLVALGTLLVAVLPGVQGGPLVPGVPLTALYLVPAVGLLAFPTWVFTPVALTRVARTDEIRAAFAWRPVLAVAARPAYLRRWARGVVFVVAGTGGYLYLSVEATLPWLVAHVAGTTLNCCCQLVAFREFGRGYAAATDGTADPAAAPTVDRPMWGERPDDWRRDREDTAWGSAGRSG